MKRIAILALALSALCCGADNGKAYGNEYQMPCREHVDCECCQVCRFGRGACQYTRVVADELICPAVCPD